MNRKKNLVVILVFSALATPLLHPRIWGEGPVVSASTDSTAVLQADRTFKYSEYCELIEPTRADDPFNNTAEIDFQADVPVYFLEELISAYRGIGYSRLIIKLGEVERFIEYAPIRDEMEVYAGIHDTIVNHEITRAKSKWGESFCIVRKDSSLDDFKNGDNVIYIFGLDDKLSDLFAVRNRLGLRPEAPMLLLKSRELKAIEER